VDERKDQPPEAGSHPPIVSVSRLSPVQEAWGAYVDHATHCPACRSRDGGRCETAETLHRLYEQLGDSASRKLGETR
jgi:hypothetical protein